GANFVNPYTSDERTDLNQVWVEIPTTLVALGGDVHIQVHGAVGPGLRVRLAREDDEGRILLATLPLALDAESKVTLPCGYFSRGGVYYLELIADKDSFLTDYDNSSDTFEVKNSFNKRDVAESDIKVKREVNLSEVNNDNMGSEIVKRVVEEISASNKFKHEVQEDVIDSKSIKQEDNQKSASKRANLEVKHSASKKTKRDVNEGSVIETGDSVIKSWKFDVLWPSANLDVTPEQIQTYPERQVTAILEFPRVVCTPVESSADFWLELLYCGHSSGGAVLCDGKNTSSHAHVLYSEQYPECVLEGADRVRVFGRDNDRLRYVAERRVRRGQHTASFDCRLFSERYPEYCFVYVSQAVTGAVADVRMDCLPTLAMTAGGAGGWGEWSPWSACPAPQHCSTRTRSRHRFCDSPPPAYGAKYCEKGKSETEAKGGGGRTFTEVDRTFLELQLADSNRKLARLRTAVDEYEQRNEELQNAYDKLDEDRADIIAYLKKVLNLKNEENNELKDKVKGLEETREIETAQFKQTTMELERNFTIMKDQLTSENKLLAGKLNTLEEFRAIRDDLMRKFENQEQAFKDQEMKYKRIIYDAEKKFIIGKDKLKKEMEGRLLQLAQDFQDATELRIAASTHRVIRENIAINNELDSILATQAKLAEQNEKFKESEKGARVAMELAEEERDKAINKNIVQLKVIDQLTTAFQDIKKKKALFDKRNFDLDTLNCKLQKLSKENESLSLNVRILEQNLHARMCEQNKSTIESSKVTQESVKLKKILKEAAIAIQAALKLDNWATTDPTREIMDRQALLSGLLEIVTKYREIQRAESMDTIASFGKVYEEGDLGFVPKPIAKKPTTSTILVSASRDKDTGSVRGEKKSSRSTSVSSSSLGSIKTIPSAKLVPPSSTFELTAKDSLPSFITSTQSTEISSIGEVEEEEPKTDIEKQLAASKLEIQKSIMKDLAYSQLALQSQARFSKELKESKSVVFEEGDEDQDKETKEVVEGEHVEGEHVEGEQVVGEHVNEEHVEEPDEENKGQAVELAACECSAIPWAGDSSMVMAEVGSKCRCGCILHLAPTSRLLAGSLRACPLRSFWLLQAGDVETTTDSGGNIEIAGGRHILVELKSGDTSEKCTGGFLGHAIQVGT
ncbi:Uncharacterized protein OBRU01_17035, partial [Operophtera brumata]